MIVIEIRVKGNKVYDSLNHEGSTLEESGIAIRRLEEIKLKLLDIDYENDLYIEQ